MTPLEIRAAMIALRREISQKCEAYLNIEEWGDHPLSLSIWPDGVLGKVACRPVADDWEELFIEARRVWAERKAEYEAKTIRAIALAIIRITADLGECTDAALRGDKFSVEDLARFGAAAVADANNIAANGPFAIVQAAKANAA